MRKATIHTIILSLALTVALFSCSLVPFAEDTISLTVSYPKAQGFLLYFMDDTHSTPVYQGSMASAGSVTVDVSLPCNFSFYAMGMIQNTRYFLQFSTSPSLITSNNGSSYPENSVSDSSFSLALNFSGTVATPTLYFFSLVSDSTSIPEVVTPIPTPTPTPTPTSTPTPIPTPTPVPVTDYFRPFKSFSGTYFDDTVLSFPDSVTVNKYQQYSGIVSDSNLVINNTSTNLDFYDDKVVYKMEYEFTPLESDIYTLNFLYDAEDWLNYSYVYYTVNGQDYEANFSQIQLNGLYSVYGAYDIDPNIYQGPPWYIWDYTLTNQKSIEVRGLDLQANTPIKISVIVSSSTLPTNPSVFEWEQFFQDTRPDSIFLTTTGGLAALPFFVSGLSFLALGALIGIILKFMR